jgi:alcohol dehydrogenase YqhD (iron-dependent ADH family)
VLDGIFRNPTTIYFGKGSTRSALDELPAAGSRVLVVHGKQAVERFGLLDLVRDRFAARDIAYLTLDGIQPNPTAERVYAGIELCRQHGIDFVLAIGGGSVIDTAKSIAAGALYEGDFFDFYLRKAVPIRMLPLGTIVTIAGAGSESSDGAVITKDGFKYACGSPAMYPQFSVLDPTYTTSVPKFLTACGVVDAISHVLERYFTKTMAVLTSTELSEGLIRALMSNGEALLADLDNYDLRADVMWAAKLAHDNTVGFGRKHDWGSHTIVHELGARYDKAHGALLAVVFPAWMTFMRRKHPDVFARFGAGVFGLRGDDAVALGAEAITAYREFLARMGMPRTLGDCLGTDVRADFEAIAKACGATTMSGTIGNFERLNTEDIVEILNLAEKGN